MPHTTTCDLHIHTKYSIEPSILGLFAARARYGPEQVISVARKKRLNAVAITDHDTLIGAELGERYIKKNKISDVTLIKGEEVSSREGHILGLGIEEAIKPNLSAEETIDQIRAQGGVVIIPHPFTVYGISNLIFHLKKIHGIEIFNPFASLVVKANKKAEHASLKLDLAQIGSTDAHTLSVIGSIFTRIKGDSDVDSILRAIRQHKTEACWDMNWRGLINNFFKNTALCFVSWYGKPKPPKKFHQHSF